MQGDGNLVLYNASNVSIWGSNAHGGIIGQPGHLAIQDDGNLFVRANADNAIMWSRTVSKASVYPNTTPFTHTLARGWTGEEVTTLQATLTTLGFYTGEVTGYFGSLTEAAVKSLQAQNNLAAVGVVGPQTRGLLERLLGY